MDPITSAVMFLNQSLVKAVLADARFNGSKVYGIAESILGKKKRRIPAIVEESGEMYPIEIDDKCPVIIFHRISSLQNSIDKKRSYGRRNIEVKDAQLRMLIAVNRKKVQLTSLEIESLIQNGIPKQVSRTDLETLALKSLNITVLNSDHESESVYAREWPAAESALKPNYYLMELRYQVGCSYDPSCINPICCN